MTSPPNGNHSLRRALRIAGTVGALAAVLFFLLAILLRPSVAPVQPGDIGERSVGGAAVFGLLVGLAVGAIVAVMTLLEQGQRRD